MEPMLTPVDRLRWTDSAPYWSKGTTLYLRDDAIAEFTLLSLCQRAEWALNAQFERTQKQHSPTVEVLSDEH